MNVINSTIVKAVKQLTFCTLIFAGGTLAVAQEAPAESGVFGRNYPGETRADSLIARQQSEGLMTYRADLDLWTSSGRFAPYFLMSNNFGRFTQSDGAMLDLRAERELSTEKRFEYGFGAEMLTGWQSSASYALYGSASKSWGSREQHPARIWLQQLWAGVKWRGVMLKAGMWEHRRSIFNQRLGSGDLTMSANARPVPRVAVGFIDFQDIPFTNGWVQIEGELSWGKMTDSNWLENHYNYYNSFITTGSYMHYSRCYFRTNPAQPFSVIVGMQNATQFGGHARWYHDGVMTSEIRNDVKFKDFINAFFPWAKGSSKSSGDAAYYDGNHLGSWDLRLRYRFRDGKELTAYMQSPWEDGSGIGKLNGFDGVWGLEYRSDNPKDFLSGAVVEYIDLTNQSGPMHWAPSNTPGTQVTSQATGADDYYNNYMYNGWANYGMALGTPFAKSPIYNTDGFMRFLDNRVRGFHLGAEGWITPTLEWRALFSFRTSWGTPLMPALERRSDTSMLLHASWQLPKVKDLSLGGSLAWDAGKLLGNNVGGFITLSYSGIL